MPSFVIAVVVGAVALLGSAARAADDDIVFAPKNYADFGELTVGISGTLTGDGIGYKNNTRAIFCIKDRMECWVSSVEQIGDKQIGRIDYPYFYPVTKWTAQEVIAEEESAFFHCSKTTITISRRQQTALWVQQPINQTRPECKDSDMRIYKWTIEDSSGWKRLRGK
jgi:hypothetical protein